MKNFGFLLEKRGFEMFKFGREKYCGVFYPDKEKNFKNRKIVYVTLLAFKQERKPNDSKKSACD